MRAGVNERTRGRMWNVEVVRKKEQDRVGGKEGGDGKEQGGRTRRV